ALAMVVALVGALVIRNAMQVSVLQRWSEIGVRRALGESRLAVAAQFTAEGGFVGLLGAAIGIPAGVFVCLLYPLVINGIVVIPWLVILGIPGGCALLGVFASIAPAAAATRVEPLEALRR